MTLREVLHSRTFAVVGATALVVSLGGVGTAVAANTIGSRDIRDGSVQSVDLADSGVHKADIGPHAVGYSELTTAVKAAITTGKVKGLESDGPYPGATQLKQGANSTAEWVADGGVTLQSSWVQCPAGKVAIGGGFSRADESPAAIHDLQIVTSRPAQFQGGVEVYTPIPGDVDGSLVANAWLVEGFNNGTSGELIVRPWVVCTMIK